MLQRGMETNTCPQYTRIHAHADAHTVTVIRREQTFQPLYGTISLCMILCELIPGCVCVCVFVCVCACVGKCERMSGSPVVSVCVYERGSKRSIGLSGVSF